MAENLTNGFITTLNGAMNNSQTTLTLTSSSGVPLAPARFLIVGETGNTDEIIYVATISGTSLSGITRAAEPIADGTQVAQAHSSGATITQVFTVQGIKNASLSAGTIGVQAYRTTNQTPITTQTAILFDAEDWDTDGFHDTGSNTDRFTVPAGLAGKYLAIGWVYVTGIAANTNYVHARITKNGISGTNIASQRVPRSPDDNTIINISGVADLVAGDYLQLTIESDDTSFTVNASTSTVPSFRMIKLDSGRVGKGVGAKVYRTTTASATGSYLAIGLDAEVFDTDGFHDTVTNNTRLTIPTGLGGKYFITFSVPGSVSNGFVAIRKNGANYLAFTPNTGASSVAAIDDAVPGDYFEGMVNATSGNITVDQYGGLSLLRVDSNASGVLAAASYKRTSADYTTTSASFVDIDSTNLALTITTGARRVLVTFQGTSRNSGSGNDVYFDLAIDGTREGNTNRGLTGYTCPGASYEVPVTYSYITEVLSAGSHTFKMQWATSAGTATLFGGTTSNFNCKFAVQELPDSGSLVANQGYAISQTYYGYNAIGASFANMNGGYAKQITLTNDGLINSIDGYIKGNSTNASSLFAHIMTDNAGVPGIVIAKHNSVDFGSTDKNYDVFINSTGRWVSVPMASYLAAGTYWIVLQGGHNNAGTQLAFDGSGTDYTNTSVYSGDATTVTYSSGSNKYSIRASFIAGTGSPLIRRPGSTLQKLTLTSGSITLTASTTTMTEASSSLRLTIAASVGDVLQIGFSALVSSGNGEVAIDTATIVGGSITNQVTPGSRGIGHGYAANVSGGGGGTMAHGVTGTLLYTVVSGDISSGSVTVSPTYINSGTSSTLFGTTTYALQYSVLNLGH